MLTEGGIAKANRKEEYAFRPGPGSGLVSKAYLG